MTQLSLELVLLVPTWQDLKLPELAQKLLELTPLQLALTLPELKLLQLELMLPELRLRLQTHLRLMGRLTLKQSVRIAQSASHNSLRRLTGTSSIAISTHGEHQP
jgi:hypothetical protein